MRMRIVSLLFVAIISGCSESPQLFDPQIEPGSAAAFAGLPDKIQMSISTGVETRNYQLLRGSWGRISTTLAIPKETNAVGVSGQGGATFLPNPPKASYQGPYAFDTSRTRVAASILSAGSAAFLPTDFVIVDVASRKMISLVNGRRNEFIDAMSWSPDGRYLAILRKIERRKFLLDGVISSLSGHPPVANDYVLFVFDQGGVELMRSMVITSAPQGWSTLIWTQ